MRSANELTLRELGQLLEPGTHEPMAIARPHDLRSLALSYHLRWAWSFGPLVLALFALAFTGRGLRRRSSLVFAAFAASLGYIALGYAAQIIAFDRRVPVLAAVWIPNAAFLVMSVAAMRRASARA